MGKDAPEGLVARICIALRAERDLGLAQLLLAGEKPLGIVDRFVADEEMPLDSEGQVVDLLVPTRVWASLGMATGSTARLPIGREDVRPEESLEARAM